MTVLQQVKDYYLRYAARPTGTMARTITQNLLHDLVQAQTAKPRPLLSQSAHADVKKDETLHDQDTEKTLITVPADKRGRYISQDA